MPGTTSRCPAVRSSRCRPVASSWRLGSGLSYILFRSALSLPRPSALRWGSAFTCSCIRQRKFQPNALAAPALGRATTRSLAAHCRTGPHVSWKEPTRRSRLLQQSLQPPSPKLRRRIKVRRIRDPIPASPRVMRRHQSRVPRRQTTRCRRHPYRHPSRRFLHLDGVKPRRDPHSPRDQARRGL